ncbi:MAG: HAD family hydrolase [Lachnospiraceae bacterium]|jgi:HAD superfamily hydrolase (TIGR01549 family)|nr:HAD family hydrolase [Lachnospiraceae bacterium]
MNKRTPKSIIWDLDGTLIDSYSVIVSSLYNTLMEKEIMYSTDDIFHYVKEKSVHQFIEKIASEYNFPYNELKSRYSAISKNEQKSLKRMPNAKEILELLVQQGVQNFIYTHRGLSTFEVVKDAKIINNFKEIVTSSNGFKRKPDPEALIYLIDKYSLDKEHTFYVGDRTVDIECSRNAGIISILLITNNSNIQYTAAPDYAINNLIEINNILNYK